MSVETLREWAQSADWDDLMGMFDKEISMRVGITLDKVRRGEGTYEVGVADGLVLGLSILENLRKPHGKETTEDN